MSTAIPYSIIGVYLITNTVTGGIYVGSTSTSIRRRWKEHRTHLRGNRHQNRHLQFAWNTYGEDVFTFTVAEVVTERTMIVTREQAWIDRYFPLGPRGCYNLRPTAASMLGFKQTSNQKSRISASNRGKKRTNEQRKTLSEAKTGLIIPDKYLKTYAGFIAPDGTEYRNITGLRRFCREHGLDLSNMYKLAIGKYRSVKGWTRVTEEASQQLLWE